MTAFAVPILSGKKNLPVGVVCCYSMIQSGSVPFVLRFVQQALHLLWSGLEKVEPHESVGQEMWQDVGPADLGEMAADVEMQQHFNRKKRQHHTISSLEQQRAPQPASEPDQSAPLSAQFKSIDFHREEPAQNFSTIPRTEDEEEEAIPEFYNFQQLEKPPEQRVSVQAIQAFQNHIKEAVRQVGKPLPFTHSHVATTADGSKRANVTHQPPPGVHYRQPTKSRPPVLVKPAPLAMPHALPTHVIKARSSHSFHGRNEHGPPVEIQNLSPQFLSSTSSQVTMNLAGGAPAPSPSAQTPATYTPPTISAPSNAPPQFTQDFGQPLPVQNSSPQTAAPSQLSQNLLSEGMLQSIANQQYHFMPVPTTAPQNQSHMAQYSAPIASTSAGMAPPAGAASLPTNGAYCVATTAGYPAPDAARSSPAMATAGKMKACRIQGCDDPAVIRRPYCARHSGNRLCEHEGCTKCAQGSTRFCIAHGGGRRCTFPGCDKGARDKFFCAAHGGGKRCKAEGCSKSAVGGSSLCTAHGGGRRCAVDGCDKSAQSSTKFCVKHGGGKKCCHEGCEKVARGRTQYCAAVSFRLFSVCVIELWRLRLLTYIFIFIVSYSMEGVFDANLMGAIVWRLERCNFAVHTAAGLERGRTSPPLYHRCLQQQLRPCMALLPCKRCPLWSTQQLPVCEA